jgi:death on curing protein
MLPLFLNLSEILNIHADQIDRYGGDPGIRDLGLLESAVAMPTAGFGGNFLHDGIFEMATAYLFHICQNHPFIDGNKRTGTTAALVFLEINEITIDCDEDELVDMVIAVTGGELDKHAIAEFLEEHSSTS